VRSRSQPVSLAQAASGLATISLVLLGIMGTVYKLIAPEGWIAQAFGRGLTAGGATLGSLLLLAACACYAHGSAPRHRLKSEILVYACAGAGVFYLARLLLEGRL